MRELRKYPDDFYPWNENIDKRFEFESLLNGISPSIKFAMEFLQRVTSLL